MSYMIKKQIKQTREQLAPDSEARSRASTFLPPFCLYSIESPDEAVVLVLHGPPIDGASCADCVGFSQQSQPPCRDDKATSSVERENERH